MLLPFHLGSTANARPSADIILDPVTKETATPKDIFISGQLPEFMVIGGSINHTKFVTFMEAYYKWMGNENEAVYESFDLENKRDIDDTIDSFVDHFYKEFMSEFPSKINSTTDKRKIIKKIKDFYEVKGTEPSYKTLFRILFNEEVEFYYPSKDLMRLSDSKWFEPNVIKTTRLNSESDLYDTLGRKLYQKNELTGQVTAYGFVESVHLYEKSGYSVSEFSLSNLFGSFQPEKYINIDLATGSTIREYVYPTLSSIGVSAGGTGYSVSDAISIQGGNGVGAEAKIVGINSDGIISKIEIIDGGVNYRETDTITASVTSSGGSNASLVVTGGAGIETREGYYSNDDSLISSDGRIQDNFYWQDFSYVLKSARNFMEYKEDVKRVIHPAGTAVFGNVLLQLLGTVTGTETNTIRKLEIPILGHYPPYKFTTHRNLRGNGVGGSGGTDLYPTGYGFSAAEGNTFAVETSGVTHNPYFSGYGVSGPLGGFTHGLDNSAGSTMTIVGTLNTPQGEQFAIVGGSTGFDSVSGGVTAGFWLIYPHPNARGITNMPINGLGDIKDIYVKNSSGGFGVGTYYVNEVIRQSNPYTQDATGYIAKINQIGSPPQTILRVIHLSGTFLDGDQEVAGQSAGYLLGSSGGATGVINNIVEGVQDSHNTPTEFGHLKVEDFLFGIER